MSNNKPQIQVAGVLRDMTDEEIIQWEKDKAEFELKAQAQAAAKAQKQALLNRLGITEEEAKLLLS